MNRQGYSADWQTIRRESAVFGDRHIEVADAKEALRKAFDRDRTALGSDQYGAELAKHLPRIEEEIFAAFDAYLDELTYTGTGLRVNADVYEVTEQANRRNV
ncbi:MULTISPECIES: hypothetical protein [unclassified Nonomuraea]